MIRTALGSLVLSCALFCLPLTLHADTTEFLGAYSQGATLPGAPDYDWWYGCSPTSAGMMMGYYDIHGYGGLSYTNLVQGGTAELSSFGTSGALANSAIASQGHVNQFWGTPDPGVTHSFDSLADYMGTSQANLGNVDGGTTFFYYSNGARLTATAIDTYNIEDKDGMYGLWEYFTYSGYAVSTNNFFTQLIKEDSMSYGFTFADYMAEIDAGRVVMLHVQGHSMFGYGYGDNGLVYLHDTWSPGTHTMTWGDSYSGLEMWGVTGFTPDGGNSPVPEPATLLLFGAGLIALANAKKRRSMQ